MHVGRQQHTLCQYRTSPRLIAAYTLWEYRTSRRPIAAYAMRIPDITPASSETRNPSQDTIASPGSTIREVSTGHGVAEAQGERTPKSKTRNRIFSAICTRNAWGEKTGEDEGRVAGGRREGGDGDDGGVMS
eukprot:3551363-Rhodomonas_salina.1